MTPIFPGFAPRIPGILKAPGPVGAILGAFLDGILRRRGSWHGPRPRASIDLMFNI
jgi:hypothetical protein